jgi:hypothetical protein
MPKDRRPEDPKQQVKKEKKLVGKEDTGRRGSSSNGSVTSHCHQRHPSPSPHGRHYRDGDWPAIQRTVKESSGAKYPMLTRSN